MTTWKHLNHLQVGKYAEYLVKMTLVSNGVDVYTAEVDDRGIDFVVRKNADTYFDIQVKSVRDLKYIFLPKDSFVLRENLFAAIVVFIEGQEPNVFLIPSEVWRKPNALLVDRNYGGELKSQPEWGLNISKKNWAILEQYRIEQTIKLLK